MKSPLITPAYAISEIFLEWADECYEQADRLTMIGDREKSQQWEKTAIYIQYSGFEFITTMFSGSSHAPKENGRVKNGFKY
jgi:hypothetical protein